MTALDHFTRWCLTRAARRWPAALRDEMHAEWLAELAALEADGGSRKDRLGFAVSLLTAPPVRDVTGAPRGWGESLAPGAPAVALLVAAVITLSVSAFADGLAARLLDLTGVTPGWPGGGWPGAAISAVITLAWCVTAGRWLGRRLALSREGRFGDAGPAALAPVAFAPMVLVAALLTGDDLPYLLGVLAGLAVWAAGTAVIGVAAVRAAARRRAASLVLLGLPLAGALGAVTSAGAFALSAHDRGGTLLASLTLAGPPAEFDVIVDGLSSRAFYYQGPWALTLACFGAFTVAYGLAALGPAAQRAPLTARTSRAPRPLPAAVVVSGATALTVAVIAWAYTLAILTPAMSNVSASAPMPGGDGELYMWTAELRAATILLATLGMLIATADRRFGVAGTLVVGAGLTLANAVLHRLDVAGAGGMRLALMAGAAPVVIGWIIAGRSLHDRLPGTALRRATVGVLVAGSVLPMITLQGTPGVNHPFLPPGLILTTTGLAVTGLLLAIVPALALGRHRVPGWAAVLLIAAPVALTVSAALMPAPLSEDTGGPAEIAAFAGAPTAVVCLALLRRHRPRHSRRTAAVWTALTIAAVPASILVTAAGALLLTFVPDLTFAIDGSGYSFDGLSFIPGAATLMLPLAAVAAARLDGAAPPPAAEPARTHVAA
ncbi:hypothetical protein [Actinoplanes sp. TFC3]|uniref:hypothetical protein n=1 Tax=Actinoplanes sp. TFC3 TaxID=1710355 RepID=UPI0008314A8F|nr:hypothetical protein [Actinoplanes sp. TFC3]